MGCVVIMFERAARIAVFEGEEFWGRVYLPVTATQRYRPRGWREDE
jgi:hypothetical protein